MPNELTADDLRFTPPRLPVGLLIEFLADHWGINGEFAPLVGERDQNFRVRTTDGKQYVFKIASPIEDATLVDFQVQGLLHLQRNDPGIPVPHIIPSLSGKAVHILTTDDGDHVIRLLSWVDGAPMGDFDPPSIETISQVGALQGRICKAFEGFEHAGASHFMPWSILNGLVESHELRTRYLHDGLAERCGPALKRLELESLPRIRRLPSQIIHNDAHADNVMCDPAKPHRVTGVIDFGDQIRAPLVVDLATSMASLRYQGDALLEAATALVKGFELFMPLPDEQRDLLYDATLARAIMTVQLLEFRAWHTEVGTVFRDVELPIVKEGLENFLRTSPEDFLQAVRSSKNTEHR